LHRVAVVLTLFLLTGSALATLVFIPLSSQAASGAFPSPLLSDDFTHDTSLNASLWQINGPVGSAMGPYDVGTSIVALEPSFSSAGMEIEQVNASQEVGTIQSVESFTPPFTASAVVEGSISNGHTFGFAISSGNASAGVLVYGNLNDTNCSHLGDCGDPNVCGTSANPSIPPNQCYYGIDAKVGHGTSWPHAAKLYLTPSVNVDYTLQISVDASGSAQYSVSQGGQVLGGSTAQVGTGPFYIIIEQGEGSPVARPGPNQAYWLSVLVTPSTATSATTTALPSPTSGSVPIVDWIVIAIVVIFLILIILLWSRRRNLTVRVRDSKTLSPIVEAPVAADGPEKLSGYTGKEGKITFKAVDKGDYTVRASATGYAPSVPAKVSVKKTTELVIGLERLAPPPQAGPGVSAPPEGPKPSGAVEGQTAAQIPSTLQTSGYPGEQVQAPTAKPGQQGPVPPATQPPPAPAPTDQQDIDLEGWGGGRVAEIIRTFREKGAISPETALSAQELGLSRLFVRIMKRRRGRTRIFMEVNGKYYLDEKALQETK